MLRSIYAPLLSTLLMVQIHWQGSLADEIPVIKGDELPVIKRSQPVDFVFLLDSSASIWPPHFIKQLEFVKYMIKHFDVGMSANQVRVGILSFSTKPHVHFKLDESKSTEYLKSRVDTIEQISGNTNISGALYQMKDYLLQPENGARKGVKRIGLIMTDGTSQNKTAAQIAAQKCRDENITLFVIGIGHKVDYYELVGIASEPTKKYLNLSPTFEALDNIRTDLILQTVNGETDLQYVQGSEKPIEVKLSSTGPSSLRGTPKHVSETRRERQREKQREKQREETVSGSGTESPFLVVKYACHNKRADVVFLIDSSSSIRVTNLKKQINVVSGMVRSFDIGREKTRIGVSIYSHEYLPILKIGELETKRLILDALSNIIYIGGGTKTGKALHRLRTEAFNPNNRRPGADQILIVFTDGQSSDYETTKEEAFLLKKSGVRIFVVSIGPYIDPVEIRDIASNPSKEFIHTEATFDALIRKTGVLTYKTCTVVRQIISLDQDLCNATQPTDIMFMISRNRFGQGKTNQILRGAAEIVNRLGTEGSFQMGVMYDQCPPDQDISIGSIDNKRELMNRMMGAKYRPLSSMFRRLHEEAFNSEGSYSSTGGDSRKVAVVFIDNTLNLNERELRGEVNQAIFEGITIYAVVIGKKVDMPLLQWTIAKGDNVIKVHSYDTLIQSLPPRFSSRVCTRSPAVAFS